MLALHSSIWGAVPDLMPGGNLGVAVFFVLSGFLITTLLLEEHGRDGRIDLRGFYIRRAARLLPGMLVLLPVYVFVFSRAQSPRELAVTVGAVLLYLSSFVQAIWGAMGNLSWTWSLSVEEHFYALWPPLLRWLLGHRRPLLRAGLIAAAIALGAAGLRIALTGSVKWNDFGYYSTFTRLDALAVGCLAALRHHHRPIRLGGWGGFAGWLALAVIGWCYANPGFAVGGAPLDVYGLPLCTLAAAVLVVTVVSAPRSTVARALSVRPLVNLGVVSYGLYLWNLLPGQTFHLIEGRHPGVVATIVLAVLMMAIVECSYWYVERPLMRLARRRLAGRREADRRRSGQPAPSRALRLTAAAIRE